MLPRVICQVAANAVNHPQVWRRGTPVVFGILQSARQLHISSSRAVGVTHPCRAEPPKKSIKQDPGIEKSRKERQLKKLQKIQFKMGPPSLKPVDEFMYDPNVFTEERKRPAPSITFHEEERRALMMRQWAEYKQDEYTEENRLIQTAKRSQQRALEELRAESEELYQKALEKDFWLFPLEIKGPTRTPPIKGYEAKLTLDGEYVDKTKQFK